MLVAQLVGHPGAAAGEGDCLTSVEITIDQTPRPPLGFVTARFFIDISSCPAGTVLTEAHVHLGPGPDAAPNERIYIDANLTRPWPLPTGSGTISSTNQGVRPHDLAEVLAAPDKFMVVLHGGVPVIGGALRRK